MKFSIIPAVFKAYTHHSLMQEVTFSQLVTDLIDCQDELINKHDTQLFTTCEWLSIPENPPILTNAGNAADYAPYDRYELIRRCDNNVHRINCLMLDIDRNLTIAQAKAMWAPYEYFIYSTFSHSNDLDKFRMVVPLLNPLTVMQFKERVDAMKQTFKVADESFAMSQCFYLPSYAAANKHLAFTHHHKVDNRYDALNLPTQAVNMNTAVAPLTPTVITQKGKFIFNKLMSGSGLRYPNLHRVATFCKTNGIQVNDFKQIVNQIADSDSSIFTAKVNLDLTYANAYTSNLTKVEQQKLYRDLSCSTFKLNRKK